MMGASGGRSAGNRTAEEATRRATQRERAYIDPPFDHEPDRPRFQLTERGERVMTVLAWGSWLFFCVLLAVVVCAWFGLIG